MTVGLLDGKTVLVVGGSSGIGREAARVAAALGARVAVAARRLAETTASAEDAGGVAIVADLRDPEDCDRIATEAVAALGKLDIVLVAAAISPVQLLVNSDAEVWRSVFETNVRGPMLVCRRLVRHMAPNGMMAFVSSDSVGSPYHGMVPYSASKAALEEAVRGLRIEHPEVRVVSVPVGPTSGTDITRGLDPVVIEQLYPIWISTGRLAGASMAPSAVADALVRSLAASYVHPGVAIEVLTLRPSTGTEPDDIQEILSMISSDEGTT